GPTGPGIVRDLEYRFLLYHGAAPLLGPLDDLDDPPADGLGDGPGFHDPDRIAQPRVLLVARLDRLAAGDLLPVHRVGEAPLQPDRDGLRHLVAGDDTDAGLPPAALAGCLFGHSPILRQLAVSLLLAQHGLDPGDVTAPRPETHRIVDRPGGGAEPEPELPFPRLRQRPLQLFERLLPP